MKIARGSAGFAKVGFAVWRREPGVRAPAIVTIRTRHFIYSATGALTQLDRGRFDVRFYVSKFPGPK